jgi:hypothetical protein
MPVNESPGVCPRSPKVCEDCIFRAIAELVPASGVGKDCEPSTIGGPLIQRPGNLPPSAGKTVCLRRDDPLRTLWRSVRGGGFRLWQANDDPDFRPLGRIEHPAVKDVGSARRGRGVTGLGPRCDADVRGARITAVVASAEPAAKPGHKRCGYCANSADRCDPRRRLPSSPWPEAGTGRRNRLGGLSTRGRTPLPSCARRPRCHVFPQLLTRASLALTHQAGARPIRPGFIRRRT